jgi:hypothetical protein
MQSVPLQKAPSQIVQIVLDGQNVRVSLAQKSQGLFVTINADGVDVVQSVLARNNVPLNCREYAGLSGNLLFVDGRGSDDPHYSGFGDRFALVYLTADEYALIRE